jgi:hypothetical protein
LFVAVFASSFFLGIASVALASEASSARTTFYQQYIAGSYLCGDQQATINNSPLEALLTTSGWSNTSCSNPDTRPAGQLGAIAYLWKGTSGNGGVLYGDTGWLYSPNAVQAFAVADECSPGTCPHASYYSSGKGRFWNSDLQQYETSSYLSDSPDLSY